MYILQGKDGEAVVPGLTRKPSAALKEATPGQHDPVAEVSKENLVTITHKIDIKPSDLPQEFRNNKTLKIILEESHKTDEKLLANFTVPKDLAECLAKGDCLRKGTALVTTGNDEIRWCLKGARILLGAAKAGKATAPPMLLVSALELESEYELNQKLRQIQDQLQRIEGYVKAQHFSSLLNAHSSLNKALNTGDSNLKAKLFQDCCSHFQDASNKNKVLFEEKRAQLHRQIDDSMCSMFSSFGKQESVNKILHGLEQQTQLVDIIDYCNHSEALVWDRLGAFDVAKKYALMPWNSKLGSLLTLIVSWRSLQGMDQFAAISWKDVITPN